MERGGWAETPSRLGVSGRYSSQPSSESMEPVAIG